MEGVMKEHQPKLDDQNAKPPDYLIIQPFFTNQEAYELIVESAEKVRRRSHLDNQLAAITDSVEDLTMTAASDQANDHNLGQKVIRDASNDLNKSFWLNRVPQSSPMNNDQVNGYVKIEHDYAINEHDYASNDHNLRQKIIKEESNDLNKSFCLGRVLQSYTMNNDQVNSYATNKHDYDINDHNLGKKVLKEENNDLNKSFWLGRVLQSSTMNNDQSNGHVRNEHDYATNEHDHATNEHDYATNEHDYAINDHDYASIDNSENRRGSISPPRRDGIKIYRCEECPAKYATLQGFNRHRYAHYYALKQTDYISFRSSKCSTDRDGQRTQAEMQLPYACENCDSAFARMTHLRKHKRKHAFRRMTGRQMVDRETDVWVDPEQNLSMLCRSMKNLSMPNKQLPHH